jgi:hypothetical protein
VGDVPALTRADVVGPAVDSERLFQASCLTPNTAPTLRRLAKLSPRTLALMHGSAFEGDGGAALEALAGRYAELFDEASRAAG